MKNVIICGNYAMPLSDYPKSNIGISKFKNTVQPIHASIQNARNRFKTYGFDCSDIEYPFCEFYSGFGIYYFSRYYCNDGTINIIRDYKTILSSCRLIRYKRHLAKPLAKVSFDNIVILSKIKNNKKYYSQNPNIIGERI